MHAHKLPKLPVEPEHARKRVLLVSDAPDVRAFLQRTIASQGHDACTPTDDAHARALLRNERFDGLLIDVASFGGRGWELMAFLSALPDAPLAVALLGQADIARADDARRLGAVDVLVKPADAPSVSRSLQLAIGKNVRPAFSSQSKRHRCQPSHQRRCSPSPNGWREHPVRPLSSRGRAVPERKSSPPHIHEMSERRSKPFVRVNLAAFPESMIEAELFGAARGAFTDSKKERPGLLASAHGGTLMLDEIHRVSDRPSAQAPACARRTALLSTRPRPRT